MTYGWLALGAGVFGCALGALGTFLWRAKREHVLRMDLELSRARLKSEESAASERELALARLREQAQAAFGDLARESLQSNSELFLQLARERLTREQADAAAALKEREAAIESMVRPIGEALARTEAPPESLVERRPGGPLEFHAEGLGLPRSLVLRPFWEIPYDRYTVYWDVAAGARAEPAGPPVPTPRS